MVIWSSSSCSIRPMALSWSSSALRSCITRWARGGVVPEGRVFGLRVQFGKTRLRACRSQRCLLSSPTDCLISSTSVSVSARMVMCPSMCDCADVTTAPSARRNSMPLANVRSNRCRRRMRQCGSPLSTSSGAAPRAPIEPGCRVGGAVGSGDGGTDPAARSRRRRSPNSCRAARCRA